MKLKQILAVTKYNFRQWHKNPRIVITFCLAFVLCFLLSDKAVKFAKEYETTMQIVEALRICRLYQAARRSISCG